MQREGKPQEVLPATLVDEWDGPWGSISPVPLSIETLRVEIKAHQGPLHIHFYPYRTIRKWTLSMDQPETLEIQAGGDHVTIFGTGLRRLAEALNLGQLRCLQCLEHFAYMDNIVIRSIEIESIE